eukprot:g20376.t1
MQRILFFRSSFWIYVVLAVHFAECLLILSKLPGDEPFRVVEGFTLSQPLQWSQMAFCLASVFFIVQAYIGAVYIHAFIVAYEALSQHKLRNLYYYFLVASISVDIAFLFAFIWAWLSALPFAIFVAGSVVFKLTALYITSKYSKLVRRLQAAELLPHLKSALGRSFNAPQFQPAPRVASMQERPSPEYDGGQKAYQTMPEFRQSPSRLVRVVHSRGSMAKADLVPYVNTWFWPSFTLVGTSSLFFGIYIGKITNSHEWKEIFLDYCHHKRTSYSLGPYFETHWQGTADHGQGQPGALCEHLVLAILHLGWHILSLLRYLHREDHELTRVEGDLFGLLPSQEDFVFAQSSGQGRPVCDEISAHRSEVRPATKREEIGLCGRGSQGPWGPLSALVMCTSGALLRRGVQVRAKRIFAFTGLKGGLRPQSPASADLGFLMGLQGTEQDQVLVEPYHADEGALLLAAEQRRTALAAWGFGGDEGLPEVVDLAGAWRRDRRAEDWELYCWSPELLRELRHSMDFPVELHGKKWAASCAARWRQDFGSRGCSKD